MLSAARRFDDDNVHPLGQRITVPRGTGHQTVLYIIQLEIFLARLHLYFQFLLVLAYLFPMFHFQNPPLYLKVYRFLLSQQVHFHFLYYFGVQITFLYFVMHFHKILPPSFRA